MNINLILLLVVILLIGTGGGYYGVYPSPWTAQTPNHLFGGIGGLIILLIILRIIGVI